MGELVGAMCLMKMNIQTTHTNTHAQISRLQEDAVALCTPRPTPPSPNDSSKVLRVVTIPLPASRNMNRAGGEGPIVACEVRGGEEVDVVEYVGVEVGRCGVLGDVVAYV